MDLAYSDTSDGIRKIDLAGRLDLEGTNAVDLRFTALTSTAQSFVIVDLSAVEFLASIGIATLVRSARAVRLRGGNMVLLSPRANVAQVLASTHVDQVLPVCTSVDDAVARVRAAPPTLT
ncbi:MAG TPA: STAS domain-containing protein [Vicinamibacterales bacterium]|jgi:anti-sigma B factor antagonist|nr:STAS domain-containing protein [Vicinamibacterales bacterium]